MERCHVPFKIERVDYVFNWLDHVLSPYRQGTEMEWENRIYAKWSVSDCSGRPRDDN